MQKFYGWIVSHRKIILTVFIAAAVCCAFLRNLIAVNYDMTDYLPESSASSISMNIMEDEFEGGIPNARVMIRNVTVPEALEYKEQLRAVDGVSDVTWLDDAVSISLPLEVLDTETVETYYKDENALFSVTIDDDKRIEAVDAIRDIIGEDNAMSGSAVITAAATVNTVAEVQKIAVFGVLFVLVVLILTTKSWMEPLLVLTGLGVAIMINSGSNLIFGEISFVSNAAGNVLQLAVSLDYSVFLIHRFEECRAKNNDVKAAMVEALCKSTTSILSSGLTTVIGFLALVLMRFRIGPDLGLVLAKGVALSLITVFVFMPALILATYKLMDRTKHRPFMPSFHKFGKFIQHVSVPLVAVFVIVIVPSYLASNSNIFSYGTSDIFGEETQVGMDTAGIEEAFGKNDTYVLLVPRGDTATETELSEELNSLPHVTGIISYVDMAGAEIPMEYLDEETLAKLVSDNYSRMVLSVDVPYEGDDTFRLVEQIRDTADKYYPGEAYLAGQGVSTYDLKETVTADMAKVNLLAIGAVFIVLLLTSKSVILPALLVLSIETAIWLNLTIPYFANSRIFYIAYLIISSIQLGSTVDYAILMSDRYKENRQLLDKKAAIVETISNVTVSILTSGSVMAAVGMLMGYISSNQLLAQLGIFIGRGAMLSLVIVLFVLPGILYLFDRWIIRDKKQARRKKIHHNHLQEE